MSTGEDEAGRAHVAAATRRLVQSVSAQLDGKNLELLEDFIENREFAVAVEWLYSTIKERSIALSAQQQNELGALAASLDIDLNSVV
jgi:hypothetical protein